MRFAIFSDLHIEHIVSHGRKPAPLPVEADVVLLAGDIHRSTKGLTWARETWPDLPICYTPGNHELYGAHLFGMLAEMRKQAEELGIFLLANNVAVFGEVRVLGTPLWTDFSLNGSPAASARAAARCINDFRVIRENDGLLTTKTMANLHREAMAFLEAELPKPWPGRTVVMTHWLQHPNCIVPQFRGSELSPYFCVDCSRLMDRYSIALWVYGHSHGSGDFVHHSGCRVISNQRGYPHEDPGANGFRTDCVLEV